MKRTTLALEEDLLRRLKHRAAEQGRTVQAVANELLRQSLARQEKTPRFKLRLRGWAAKEQPGVDILDRDSVYDVMDERRR